MQPRKTPSKTLYVHRGTARPLSFRVRMTAGTLRQFTTDTRFRITLDAGGTIELTVGNGVELTTDEGVAQARVTATLTVAQSRQVLLGNFARYEVQDTEEGREQVVLMGRVIGIGGDNQDG